MVTSPADLLDGFAKGTESLVEHSLKGVLKSLSSVSGAMNKGLDRLAADASHASHSHKPHAQGLIEGMENGGEALTRPHVRT